MSKKNKNRANNVVKQTQVVVQQKPPSKQFVVTTVDELSVMTDDELKQLASKLYAENIDELRRYDPVTAFELEIEICYLQREFKLRADRFKEHCSWLHEQSFVTENEDSYDEYDFDNIHWANFCNKVEASRAWRGRSSASVRGQA